ncbi:immunoglobulin lambda-like polypeptide 5 [Piliocolobus tephrosceles]|uniref:immunoglobulin lambda-like polypeptide 5 n=1 Tax=Piliocolobus tephrosceles TaxID=591936 RepID=UPI000E6B32AF|nr:immunoglobulin lambda-like polypeptide 5 [Piliocolobus tephrosceles]
MRPKTGQVGRETPEELGLGPTQCWPLLLLGLAVVTHGLLHCRAGTQTLQPQLETADPACGACEAGPSPASCNPVPVMPSRLLL